MLYIIIYRHFDLLFYPWPAGFFQHFFPPTLGTVLWALRDPGDGATLGTVLRVRFDPG